MEGGEKYKLDEGYEMPLGPPSDEHEEYFKASNSPLSNIASPTGAGSTVFSSASMPQDFISCQDAALEEGVDRDSNRNPHKRRRTLTGVEEEDCSHAGDANDNGWKSAMIDLVLPAAHDDAVDTFVTPSSSFDQTVLKNPDLINANSVNMLSTTPKTRLFNLMHIRSDKQDLSFVEKVMLPQADIFDLCNRIVPGSARLVQHENQQFDQQSINFDLLKRFPVHPVGFYGNKTAMMEIFGGCGIVDDVTLKQMREGNLLPGLYGALREEILHIFYWHQGASLSEASRKDISCNFIRYLVELCPIVHICLDATGLEASLLSSKSTFQKKVRTQRLKLFVEKSSENDLKVHPGFEIHLPNCENALTPTDRGFSNELSGGFQGFQLAEGYHAGAILVASALPPKKSTKTEEVNLKRNQIPSLLKGWESQFNLDPSRLTDDQFALFLEAAEAPGYKDLCDLIESSKNKTKVQANKTYELDSLVSEAEQVVLGIFEEALSAYLKLDFPWEESLLSDSSAFENAQAGLHEKGESYCEGDQSASQELQSPSQHALAPKEHDELEFNEGEAKHNSEQKLSFLWTGKRRSALNESELLFDGSEISFMLSADKSFSFSTYLHGHSKFSIHVNRSGRKHFGPLFYGKKYILKALPGQPFFHSNVQISAHHGSLEIGPVLISQPLYLQVLTGPRTGRLIIQGGIQVHKSISPHPMLAWMKSLNDSIVVPLRRKAFLVNHFFTTLKENSMSIGYHLDGQACPIPAMLLGNLEEVDTKLRKGEAYLVKMIWKDVMRAGNSEQFESPNITSALSLICSSLHKRNRDLYVSKVKSMVIDDIVPLLKLKIQADQKEQMAELERQFREEKSRLLQKLRRQYLAKLEGLPTLSLVSFMSSQARQGYLNKVKGKMMELSGMGAPEASFSIRYSTEVFGKEDLSWMAIEILPMKKDLEILNTNAAHVISPRLNPHSVSLLDVISTETRLAKVVCLKSGQALLFVQKYVGDPLFTIYHCQKLTSGHYGRPIKELKRPVDAMAFDETSRFAAFYAKQYATIRIFFFDEAYMNMDVTGLHLELAQYSGSQIITWMRFVPGKKELVLVDATKCIRLFELTQSVMMRPRQIQLSFPFVKACITADGSYLIVFNSFNKAIKPAELLSEDMDCEQENSCADTGEEVLKRNASERYLELEIYRLDSMLHLKTVPLDVKVDDLANLEANM